MKHIIKGNPPSELRRWFDRQPIVDGHRLNCSYKKDLPGDVKRAIKQKLLEEQGWLCCYTGSRIEEQTSHIEHFKPQELCKDHEDVDYANLLAAYPGDKIQKCPFGAHEKYDWYDPELLISPLHKICERRFRFTQFGDIRLTDENDQAAVETMRHLRLDHDILTEMRRHAIKVALFPKNRPLSKAQLAQIAERYCERGRDQRFHSFCFVIKQVAEDLLRKAEQNRKHRLAIHRQRDS
jgi:uncharacterized protein (TIGR02646 family)